MGEIKPHILIANIIGVFGIFCCIMIYQQTERKRLLRWKLLADSIWAIQYLILGAYAGMGTALIAIIRGIIFLRRDPQKSKGVGWLLTFLTLSVTVAALTWKNGWNVFTLTASLLGVTSFWIGNPRLSRILSFPISLCMLTYDVTALAVMGIVNECMAITSSAIGIIRHDTATPKGASQKKATMDSDKEKETDL